MTRWLLSPAARAAVMSAAAPLCGAAGLVLVASSAPVTSGSAASFDCTKASSSVERMICSSKQLSDADEQLQDAFAKALSSAKDPRKLKAAQLRWMKTRRDRCRDATCMMGAYQSRLAELRSSHPGAVSKGDLRPFGHLNMYGGEHPQEVLKDKELRSALQGLVGKHFGLLERYLDASSGTEINGAGALEAEGCVSHACNVTGAKIYIDRSGRIFVAILDNDKIMYFTNDQNNKTSMIDPIKKFVDHVNSPFDGEPKAKVVFMSQ